jgi:hypothetical protein
MEYERCMIGMKGNLKHVLEIAETAADPKTKLQARAIANDCYKYIMDLTTNGVVVSDALNYVNGKAAKLVSEANKSIAHFDHGIIDTDAPSESESESESTITNGVF